MSKTEPRHRRRVLPGMKFGRLTVRESDTSACPAKWICDCDCGSSKSIAASSLNAGLTRSCGCLRRETTSNRRFKHGESNESPEYRTWRAIKRRCLIKSDKKYPEYGGRGISMCERWILSYENFLADMGRKPSPSHSIDRINVNGNYEPSNCRWATPKQQGRNQRKNVFITFNGKTQTQSAWAEEIGCNSSVICRRIMRGWSIEDALTVPVKK